MFRPDATVQHLPATREQVVAVVESINQPQVSIPGKPVQTCVAHLCGVRNANGSFSIYVGLHLPATGENVVYTSDRRPIGTVDEYREVELEALQFLESMGFILDNLNFRNLPPDQQDKTLRRIPLFSPTGRPALTPVPGASPAAPAPAAAPAAAAPADEAARVARLLASF